MTAWKTDDELFTIARSELFSSVLGDVMNKLGLLHQFLPPAIRALHPDMILVGRSMPVLSVDVFQERIVGSANKLMEKPFGLMLEALDDLKRNEIYLNTGSSPRNALWGEMMSTRALKLGAAGAALNGYNRDTRGILKSMGVDGEQLSALAHFRTRRPATSFLITPQYRSLTTGEAKHQYNGGACSQATNLLPALPESIAICPGLSYEAAGEKSALAELL